MNRLLGYLVTLLMIFFVLDGTLRLVGCSPKPTINQFHDSWGWEKKPGESTRKKTSEFDITFAINEKGLRGPEIDYAKPSDTTRILFVGDSFTLGYTVDEQDLFLRLLEQGLIDSGHKVQVLNGGTEGYSTDQELVWLEEEGLKYDPDIVVLAPYLNDIFWNTQAAYTVREKPSFEQQNGELVRVKPKLDNSGETSWLVKNTAMGNAVNTLKLASLIPTTTVGGKRVALEDAPLLRDEPVEITDAWKVTEALLNRFAAVVNDPKDSRDRKLVALLVPNKWEVQADAPMPPTLPGVARGMLTPSAPTDRFEEVCSKAGYIVVDPRQALRERADAGDKVYFDNDWHWNEAGNHIVANVLFERFQGDDLIGAGTIAVEQLSAGSGGSDAAAASAGLPTWVWIVGALWLVLGTLFWRSYPEENPILAYLKVGLLIGFVAGVFLGIAKLASSMPPSIGKWIPLLVVVFLVGFILVKVGKQLGVISELYGTFLRRGHWYMLPMLVVMLSIGMLLVVAASSPFVAPFIYTLF